MYSHSAVLHYIWSETGHWKQGIIGIQKTLKGWASGLRIGRVANFDAHGKGPEGSYIDLSTIKEN